MTDARKAERDLVGRVAMAVERSQKFAAARAALPAGTTRARVTTANARWARAAEERDRLLRELAEMQGRAP